MSEQSSHQSYEGTKDIPSLEEATNWLKSQDNYQESSEDDQATMLDNATNMWLDSKGQKVVSLEEANDWLSSQDDFKESSEEDQKTMLDNARDMLDEKNYERALVAFRETERWRNATENERKEAEKIHREKWEQARVKSEVTVSPEIIERLKDAEENLTGKRDVYATCTAHDRRRFWGRFLESDSNFFSRFIKKIPGAKRIAGFINENITVHKGMDEARALYGEGLKEWNSATEAAIDAEAAAWFEDIKNYPEKYTEEDIKDIEERYSEKELRARKLVAISAENVTLEVAIQAERVKQSKKATRFTNWWARQRGLKGYFKKAGVVLGAGFVAGTAVAVGGLVFGAVSPVIASAAATSSLAGGATGLGMGLHINSRRANSYIDKDKTITVAQQDAAEGVRAKGEHMIELSGNENATELSSAISKAIIAETESRTADIVKRNRNRLKALIALGASGGRAAAALVDALSSLPTPDTPNVPDGGSGPDTPNVPDGGDTPAPPEVPRPNPPTPEGLEFTVEPGNGYTHELMDFAKANGRALSDDQSFRLHTYLMDKFGPDYIDINGPGSDIYSHAGDIRLMEPGAATWQEGVPQAIMEWLNSNGI